MLVNLKEVVLQASIVEDGYKRKAISKNYYITEKSVNPNNVVEVSKFHIPEDRGEFCLVKTLNSEFIVLGSVLEITEKLNAGNKQVLKG